MTMPNVMLTGGTGLVGSKLCDKLLALNYKVFILTRGRSIKVSPNLSYVNWDIANKHVDKGALPKKSEELFIIHLAGASVADQRWTSSYKTKILNSRVDSLNFLLSLVGDQCKHIVSASGVNYYFGPNTDKEFKEEDAADQSSFLGQVCVEWEKAALENTYGIPAAVVRTGTVLSKRGGAFGIFKSLAKKGLLMPLGSGKQWLPWIHNYDLCEMYIHLLEKRRTGAFNAVASEQIIQKDFFKQLANKLNKWVWPPLAPKFAIKLAMGERATIILNGAQIDNQKILDSGFKFKYPAVDKALDHLVK
ncbi:TIGR01777 family oxidoreductase [Luteibaculum oceani]|uniref:TIGR01777 family protein n=1 Tax=Luteibaculum oceani TaxID=1294296 RepID=A0A5C6V2Q3_9FLAO|nr:TIGR01777 family oxidoreductase [Luteibaculum oceani]TXC78931.1 TIGR01777 family protein [Luteibaculum oceani]